MARQNRRTKHRGNAAGMIESRGRTGRKPTRTEKGSAAGGSGGRGSSSAAKKNRYDSPPTWKGSAIRAVIAAAVVYALSSLLINKHNSATSNLVIVPVVLALYTPMIYYTDNFMYKRRLAKKSGR